MFLTGSATIFILDSSFWGTSKAKGVNLKSFLSRLHVWIHNLEQKKVWNFFLLYKKRTFGDKSRNSLAAKTTRDTQDSVPSTTETPRISSKYTPLRGVFSTLFSVSEYPDETLSLVFDVLHSIRLFVTLTLSGYFCGILKSYTSAMKVLLFFSYYWPLDIMGPWKSKQRSSTNFPVEYQNIIKQTPSRQNN